MPRILIVEDNVERATHIAYSLRLEGHEVRIAEDGVRGVAAAREWKADLMILDAMLPGIDEIEVLHAVRSHGHHVPVLMLAGSAGDEGAARGPARQRQRGDPPADDVELMGRVSTMLRRVATSAGAAIRFGVIVVDPITRTVTRAGTACALTPKAFALLMALVRRCGAVASRAELLQEVWGYGSVVRTRTVDSHVAELRRKLEDDPAHPRYIITVWTVGYRWVNGGAA